MYKALKPLKILYFCILCGLFFQFPLIGTAQLQHILPEEIREKRQAIGAMENISRQPAVFQTGNLNPEGHQVQINDEGWLPGEFEESKAVVLSWGEYDGMENLDTTSNLARISAALCRAIQPEAQVWIRIHKAQDSLPVKRYMANSGEALYNYRFIVKHGDNWWARDFGPIGYYRGSTDSLHFSDFKYYPGREHDNALPATTSYLNRSPNVVTRLAFEGGNLIADGFGKVFYSDVVTEANTATGNHFPTLGSAQVADSMARMLRATSVVQLPALNCDGGTGHLDLYLKMMDEETWIAGQYPSVISASDRQLSENNITFLKGLNSAYNRPYRIFRIPLPTDNNGSYSQQLTCNGLNSFGRSFINGITVNKTFIYPIWDSPGSGNTAQRLQVEANMRRWFPGLKLVGIDVRAMTGFGGQLHCITMQIPSENPVKFWHPAWRDEQAALPAYPLIAQIRNRSGIDSAWCNWRKGSQGAWNHLLLEDSAGYFKTAIPGSGLLPGDTIQYYLSAITNNGKQAFKPITAPVGFYEFVVENVSRAGAALSSGCRIYPNPGSGKVRVEGMPAGNLQIIVRDASGRQLFTESKYFSDGTTGEIDFSMVPTGFYFIEFRKGGELSARIKYGKN